MRAQALAAPVALLLALALGGCASVEPWDRGVLLKPQMAPDPMPMRRALRAHVDNSRQAAPAARTADGAACGCY